MTDLRKHLESAREKHRSQRYPGDLAAELLPQPRRTVLKIFTAAAAISAVAAAIVLWVGSRPIVNPTEPGNGLAINKINTSPTTQPAEQPGDDNALTAVATLASVPEFPEDVPMAPSFEGTDVPMAPSFGDMELGAMPSMPSMDMSFTDIDTQISKEST
jgi:hypothetical protein